jgi:hypothetical protein
MILRAAILALLLSASASAETFRCGKWIVDTDTTVEELTQKCGPPTSRESKTEEVKTRNRNNGLWVRTGETTTEIWTFDRGPGAAPMVVTIIDGKIKSIERQAK